MRRILLGLAAVGVVGASLAGALVPGQTQEPKVPDPKAVEHARQIVQVADNMHKAYVIHITGTYVKAQESVPAAQLARKVYKHMDDNKFFNGRLIDASGKPINTDNAAKTAFEKNAVAAIQKGAKYFEEVGVQDGKHVLRAGTIVPAVMKQCTTCHSGTKEGDLLGVLTYEVPIR